MPNTLGNRVKMSVSGAPGTGTITLGSAMTGYQSFAAAGIPNAATVPYLIEDGSSWEIGVGTYTSTGTTLARTSITASSNAGAAISATSAALVMVTPLAADLQSTDTLTSGILGVARGGTGVATLTGIIKASGTSAFSAATAGTDYVAPGGALGTPASGTLTSCTGLPISTGVSGLGTGAATALGVNVGSAGAFVTNGGALGTPASGTLTNCTFPTLNQNTTGTASNITGTLAVSQGGTGATATTGSGSNVLATSPTLVSPALGTPVSGNLANCTFPTLNQNTTGTAAGITGLNAAPDNYGTAWPHLLKVSSNGVCEFGRYLDFHSVSNQTGTDFDARFDCSASNTLTLTTTNFTLAGNFSATGNVTAYSSDKRLKKNVANITNPIEKIMSIGGYTFDWEDDCEELGFTPVHKQNDIGTLAQEIQAVLPQAVALAPFDAEKTEDGETISKSGKNYLTVQYERIVPLLIEAIKAQQVQIDELKGRLP